MDDTEKTVIEAVRLTPAERAVLVEQAEAAKVHIDQFIEAAKDKDPETAIYLWSTLGAPVDYVSEVLRRKITEAAQKVLGGDGL